MKRRLLALGLGLLGCGRQELDLLVPSGSPDPCLSFTTEPACDENAALGCSFQPNAEGCRVSDPNCLPGMCSSGDPFVRRVEQRFLLNGQSFRFAGVSSWALLQPERCATVEPAARVAWIEQAFDELVPSRAKVARFFAFQSCAGPSGADFSRFDAAVRAARRAGVRLQFALEHGDGGCSEGEHRDSAWYLGGYKTPDGAYARSYRDYAAALAERYRDEPAVLGYLLIQGLGGADPDAMVSFVNDIGQTIHGLAPSQLISIDVDWSLTSADDGAVYRRLQAQGVVDFVDVDDYVFTDTPEPLDTGLLAALRETGKPAVIGEGAFGLTSGEPAALVERSERARQRLQLWADSGFTGALLWAYQPGWQAISEEFDARPGDPMLQAGGVLAEAPF